MKALFGFFAAITLTFSPLAIHAQTAAKPAHPAAAQASPTGRVHQEPCWQQVGISKAAMQQRDQVARERREQIQAVCADSSLTPKEKQQKIKEIRQQAKEKMDTLVSAEQEEQLHACQKERAGNESHPSAPAAHHSGNGPCGEIASSGNPPPPQNGDENRPHEGEPAPQ
ncbi:MAG TPA: hypothetical protein VFA85_05430 [Terriglobales bacterium]|nr:hypothetical protein [Terriglobales bacterium]